MLNFKEKWIELCEDMLLKVKELNLWNKEFTNLKIKKEEIKEEKVDEVKGEQN